MAAELHRKYRPEYFKDVLGQGPIIKSLEKIVERNDVHCFLFTGGSGCGKTTLARILAAELDCDPSTILEVNAATHSGADAMRAIQEPLQYKPFGEAKGRAVIIDECHSLSKQAWQALLKGTEEPNDFVYWFFCTTEPGKVPVTMKTRAASFQVKSVPDDLLTQLCEKVCKLEKIKLASGVHDLLLKAAGGSPRQLLVSLATVRDCENRQDAASLLKVIMDGDVTLKLCQLIASPQKSSWAAAMALVEDLKEESVEGIRIQIVRYLAKIATSAATNEKALKALERMEAFERPYNESEGNAPLLLSIGRAILG